MGWEFIFHFTKKSQQNFELSRANLSYNIIGIFLRILDEKSGIFYFSPLFKKPIYKLN